MTYCLIYIYTDVIEGGGVPHRGNLTNKHGQRRNSSRQKEVTFPKALCKKSFWVKSLWVKSMCKKISG